MKSKFFLTAALPLMAAALALVFTGCSGDDDIVPESREGQSADKGYTIFSTGTPETRTTMGQITLNREGNMAGTLPFYWTDRDMIWVKDDNGIWQHSDTLHLPKSAWGWPTMNFKVPGKFSPDKPHEVRYTGRVPFGKSDGGFIMNFVDQRDPIRATEQFNFGDCGIDTAKWENGHYTFTLQHKLAYLCILPYSTDQRTKDNFNIMYITISSDQYISMSYKINDNGEVVYNGDAKKDDLDGIEFGKKIQMWTGLAGALSYKDGKERLGGACIRTPWPDPTVNAYYFPIIPGKHKIKVAYHMEGLPGGEHKGGDTYHLISGDFKPGKVYIVKSDLLASGLDVRTIGSW